MAPRVTVVIPVYNEAGNLPKLLAELTAALQPYDHELLFVDDGSSDTSLSILKQAHKDNPKVRIVTFNGNYGQHAAYAAGFAEARGDIIAMMDSDLQNDPNDLPSFIDSIEKDGMAAAFGWRINRENDLVLRQWPSRFFNWMRNKALKTPLHDYGCGMNAFKRQFVDELKDNPEILRHITTYIASKNVPVTEVKIEERKRYTGRSHYDLMRLLQLGLDLLTLTSLKPVATAGLLATSAVSLVLAVLAFLSGMTAWTGGEVGFFRFLVIPFVFFLGFVVCAALALVNERLAGLMRLSHKKPLFVIKEIIG